MEAQILKNTQSGITSKNFLSSDRAGIVCSGACVVHCLFLPVLTIVSPSISAYFENEFIHVILLLMIVPIACISFFKKKSCDNNLSLSILAVAAITFLSAPILIEYLLEIHNHTLETTLSIIGSALLITAHIKNISQSKKCLSKVEAEK